MFILISAIRSIELLNEIRDQRTQYRSRFPGIFGGKPLGSTGSSRRSAQATENAESHEAAEIVHDTQSGSIPQHENILLVTVGDNDFTLGEAKKLDSKLRQIDKYHSVILDLSRMNITDPNAVSQFVKTIEWLADQDELVVGICGIPNSLIESDSAETLKAIINQEWYQKSIFACESVDDAIKNLEHRA